MLELNAFASVDFTKENRLIIVTSTWGDGDPPDNAAGFWQHLNSGAAPQIDESVRSYISQLDAAIKQSGSDKLFALVIKNNLKRFVQGLTVSRPASWVTEILHAEQVDANRVVLDVSLKVKSEGKDQTGTAVYVLARSGSGWVLEDVPHQLFNVK